MCVFGRRTPFFFSLSHISKMSSSPLVVIPRFALLLLLLLVVLLLFSSFLFLLGRTVDPSAKADSSFSSVAGPGHFPVPSFKLPPPFSFVSSLYPTISPHKATTNVKQNSLIDQLAEDSCENIDRKHQTIEQAIGISYEESLDGGGASLVDTVDSWREDPSVTRKLKSFLRDILNAAGVGGGMINEQLSNKDSGLSKGGKDYINTLIVYLIPSFIGILLLITVLPLAFCTCCCSTKCNRCIPCLCCLVFCCGSKENAARRFPLCNRISASLGYFLLTGLTVALALVGVFWMDKLNHGLSKTQCVMSSLVRDAVNGWIPGKNQTTFVGIVDALQTLDEVSSAVKPEGETSIAQNVRQIVGETLDVTDEQEQLVESLRDFVEVIQSDSNNPERSTSTHHMFVFNAILSKLLNLPTHFHQIEKSLDSTVSRIKTQAEDQIDVVQGELTSMSEQLNTFDYGGASATVNKAVEVYSRINQNLDISKPIRYWVMLSLFVVVLVVSILSFLYVLYLYLCSSAASGGCRRAGRTSVFERHGYGNNQRPASDQIDWPSTKPAICCCMSNLLCSILALVLGGLCLAVSIVQNDTCKYSRHELLTEPGVTEFMKQIGIDSDEAINTAKACLVKGGNSDLGDALGLQGSFDKLPILREYLDDVEEQIPMPFNVSFVNELVYAANDYGWVFVLNQTDARQAGNEDRLDTYSQVLRSGIQDKERHLAGAFARVLRALIVDGGDSEDDAPIYGLLDIEHMIEPFYFQALHGEGRPSDPDRAHMITSDFNPDSPLVLESAMKKFSHPEDQRQYLNAVWWAVKKQQLRSSKIFYCPKRNGSGAGNLEGASGVKDLKSGCTYNEFVKYLTYTASTNVKTASDSLAYTVEEGKATLLTYVNRTADNLLTKLDRMGENLDCGTTADNANELVDVWCGDVADYVMLVSIVWVLLGCLMFIGFVATYFMWRVLDHNRRCDRLSRLAVYSAYEANPAYYQYA